MNESQHLDELLASRSDKTRRAVEPCTVVIFGASGDLTARKLVPALYHLALEKLMPEPFSIIGFARREKTDESFRQELREALDKFTRTKPVDEAVWKSFSANLRYCQGDMADPAAYGKLKDIVNSLPHEKLKQNLLFYLATSPSQFGEVVENLSNVNLLHKADSGTTPERIVVEKPFGHDLASAEALNADLTRYVHERQIFRIDHYLGKETVQNILTFRFSNGIFERLWNRESISHVQITVAEKNLKLGEEQLRLAQQRYQQGVADNREVVEAQNQLAIVEDNFVDAVYQYNLSRVELARARGDVRTVLLEKVE
jgi:glucose-6-phosphate 1-dehydrogenase